MKLTPALITIGLVCAVGLLAATTNKFNWLTQVLGGGTTATGLVAVTNPNGTTAWVAPGTGILATPPPVINFANAVNVPGTPNGTITAFTLAQTPKSAVSIMINGQVLDPSNFTVSGAVVTFLTAPIATDNLQATYLF